MGDEPLSADSERDRSCIEDLVTTAFGLVPQIAGPAHHAFMREFGLLAILSQPCGTNLIVTVDEDDASMADASRGHGFIEEGNAHLSLEENALSGFENRGDPPHPLKGHAPLPAFGAVAVSAGICGHVLGGGNADGIKEEDYTAGGGCLYGMGEGGLPRTRCPGKDEQRTSHGLSIAAKAGYIEVEKICSGLVAMTR